MLSLRKILFLMYLIAVIFPLGAIQLANATGNYNLTPWGFILFVFLVLPAVDQMLGNPFPDPLNIQLQDQEKKLYYSVLVFFCVPAVILLTFYGAHFFSHAQGLTLFGRIGWIISFGICIAALALSAGHEMIHRETPIERLIGGFLYASIGNSAFKIEHIRGHHLNVATPADNFSATYDQSFYNFFLKALPNAFMNAWHLEKKRLNRRKQSALSWRNEMIYGHALSLAISIICYHVFGLSGIIFFVGLCMVSLITHLVINFIQHYGLRRRKLADGRYESFSSAHAWGSNFLISNMVSFSLPRHADHHLHPGRRYPVLQHIEKSPQMPMGYFGMFLMALIPPLWNKVMNPRVVALMEGQGHKTEKREFDTEAIAHTSTSDSNL